MNTIKSIHIQSPCHESWDAMAPNAAGRHCQSCSKTVVDFSQMTTSQIVNYLGSHKTICGRFESTQFDHINKVLTNTDATSKGNWKRLALVAGFIGTAWSFKASAQVKQQVEQAPKSDWKYVPNFDTDLPNVPITRTVSGTVLDEMQQPMPGVTIRFSDGSGTQTNVQGRFKLSVPIHISQATATFIGYQTKTFDLSTEKPISVKMEPNQVMMGEVVIVRRPKFFKRMYYKMIKRPIKKIFG